MYPRRPTTNRANQRFRDAKFSGERPHCTFATRQASNDRLNLRLSQLGLPMRASANHIGGSLPGPVIVSSWQSFGMQSRTVPVSSCQQLRVSSGTVTIAAGDTLRMRQDALAPLLDHVAGVSFGRSQPQVPYPFILNTIDDINPVIIVPGTRRVVANVVDLHTVWDGAAANNPRRAVCPDIRSIPPADANPSVAFCRKGAPPAPASNISDDHQLIAVGERFAAWTAGSHTNRSTMDMHWEASLSGVTERAVPAAPLFCVG